METVSFEIAKKLKKKGFTCEYPFAMYTEYEQFCPLYTSDEYYFRIDDFGKHNYIAPTISQVLKWLREVKKISIEPTIHSSLKWVSGIYSFDDGLTDFTQYDTNIMDDTIYIFYDSYELAALTGVEYCLDNLI